MLIRIFIVSLVLFRTTFARLSLGLCSLSCNENESAANEMLGDETRVQGTPGKRGPAGPAGPMGLQGINGLPGSPGESCDCSRYDELFEEVMALKRKLSEVEDQIQYGGWYKASNNLYYRYFQQLVDYQNAKSRCEFYGGRLAAAGMRTPELRRELANLLPQSIQNTWVGLDDLKVQGNYVWSDGVASTRENTAWYGAEPTNVNERCVAMYEVVNGLLVDITCSRRMYFICEAGY